MKDMSKTKICEKARTGFLIKQGVRKPVCDILAGVQENTILETLRKLKNSFEDSLNEQGKSGFL